MAVETILVPMDGSPLSKRALRIALAEYPGASVTVLHVINPAQPGYSYPVDYDPEVEPLHGSEAWYERSEAYAEELFETARDVAAEYDAELDTALLVGEPGRAIIDYARRHEVDEIVIGSHGRDEAEQFFLGSVTETVVFRSPVRVLLVR